MRPITFLFCLFAFLKLNAQAVTIQSDTIPVWIVFLDSVRVFAAYPGVDMRTDVAPGWRIITVQKDGFDFIEVEQFFDTNGVEFDPDMVLLSKRRKVTPNRFRQ